MAGYKKTAFALLVIGIVSLTHAEDLPSLDTPLPSPDKVFEVYRAPLEVVKDVEGKPQGVGTQLFGRLYGSKEPGILIRANSRWMAAQWSPHRDRLGIEDHTDGHISEVYVYELIRTTTNGISSKLAFHAEPNGYDIRWYIEGWDTTGKIIHLRKEELRHPKNSSGKEELSSNQGTTVSFSSFTIDP